MKSLLLTSLFLLLTTIVFSQKDTTFTLQGVVYDETDGESLYNAAIFLSQNGKIIDSTFSNEEGKYYFKSLKNGCYDLEGKHKEYLTASEKRCFLKTTSKTQKHDFYLKFTEQEFCKTIKYFALDLQPKKVVMCGNRLWGTRIKIVDSNEKPLEDVLIFIESIYPNMGLKQFFARKHNGQTIIDLYERGDYNLIIWKENYVSIKQKISIKFNETPKEMIIILEKET